MFSVLASGIMNAIYHTIAVEPSKRPKDLRPSDFYIEKPTKTLSPKQAEYARKQNGKRRHSNR